MTPLMLYLHVHQPYRIRPYSVFEMGQNHDYFLSDDDRYSNHKIFQKIARKSYLPMNRQLKKLLESYPGFRLSLSLSGTFLEQCQQWSPDVLRSFQELVTTGRVDIVAETYYHSLAFFYSRYEFEKQVMMHREQVEKLFGIRPKVFRNTELAYNDALGEWAESAGYSGILAEGWDPALDGRSPNKVYTAAGSASGVKLLLKNYRMSDDIAFRFSDQSWSGWPLTADKFLEWLPDDNSQTVGLFMDYETFGEHQWASTGIFDFFDNLVSMIERSDKYGFMTVSEAARLPSGGSLSMPRTVTWADSERDLSAWLGNKMQQEAARLLYDLENSILATHDKTIIDDWRRLQTSDHVYYMCTKWFNDGDVHAYFSPYESPYEAFVFFMNVLRDLRWRVIQHHKDGR